MWRYAMKRVLLILPTVGLILLFAFVLQSYSSKDEVASLVVLDGERGYSSRASYMKVYRAYAIKLGYDRPLFYFSIQPDYIPDGIYQILPRFRNTSIRRLLWETKDADGVMSLANSVNQLQTEMDIDATDERLKKILSKIETTGSLQELKSVGFELEAFLKNEKSEDQALREVDFLIKELNYSSAWVFPKIVWHGSYNRCHMWLCNGFNFGGGISLADGTPASQKVFRALKWTLAMSIITLILVAIGSLLLSLLQVQYQDSLFEKFVTTKLYLIYAMPLFWIATIMVVFFTTSEYGEWTNIFPSVGIKRSYGEDISFLSELWNNSSRLILPVLCLSLHSLAYVTKQLKEEMIATLKKPFIIAARARGLNDIQILKNHVLPNSMISYVTLISGGLASLFTGSVVIEVIFNIPGLGRLLLDSMNNNDWPVIFLILILVSISTMLGYLLGDIMLAFLSPKIRSEMEIA
ncbi:MAG: peptide/nickel transport system permease protein [Saprospiraceae bacterium]|jgi:peptide/nickel transport system permease protein